VFVFGIGMDLLHHASQAHHEAERVFDSGNPGHLIAVFGLYNLVAGLALTGFSYWVLGRWRRGYTVAALSVLAVAVTAASFGVVRLDQKMARNSVAEAAAHNGNEGHHVALLAENSIFAEIEELTFKEPANRAPVARQNLNYAEDFIAKAREGTEKYKDVDAALADGYIQITPYIPIIGAHFANPTRAFGLDPAHPPILLYRPGQDGKWELVGAAYTLRKRNGQVAPPPTPLGGLAQWHYHTNLCFQLADSISITYAANAGVCSGQYVAETPWLLHAWLWLDSPEGVFNHANSLLQ
jgi:hypothetical protein